MSLRQMEYFLTVVEESSFTRAAERLHVTQPALSHQIKALERAVGGALLERLPRGVRLTAMGRAFLPHAERAVRSAAQARRAARAAAGAHGGELHIATVHAIAVGILPDVFARWRAAHPGVALVLHEYATTEALEEQIERGTADLAVGPPPARWSGPVVPIGAEDIVLVVPFDDPLAGRTSVRLQELADRSWVRCAMEAVVEGLPFLDWACARAGFTPRTAVRTEHTSTAVRMAAAGVGVATAPAHVVRGAVGEDCALLTVDPAWRRELAVFSRVELTGAAAAFTGLLADVRRGTAEAPPASPGRPRADCDGPVQVMP
ncbi:LysR family transcriptional regulator [Streptomyces sp. NBC_00525]|uniref:LysR family transcriptional regulator n=1 Tax=Streptomyces sp. NBC_00525 TaxID=2903660 RepID=UPI002E81920D|nr:LysR family transcriptional regulator [Streptomyces sp. NBC_00525]WUC96620.1 LysR family transcriptional regulator [Streptomyces sp. NBC_00525]